MTGPWLLQLPCPAHHHHSRSSQSPHRRNRIRSWSTLVLPWRSKGGCATQQLACARLQPPAQQARQGSGGCECERRDAQPGAWTLGPGASETNFPIKSMSNATFSADNSSALHTNPTLIGAAASSHLKRCTQRPHSLFKWFSQSGLMSKLALFLLPAAGLHALQALPPGLLAPPMLHGARHELHRAALRP